MLEKIRNARSTKSSDCVPTLYANVPRVLSLFWQRLDFRQRILAGSLDIAAYREPPLFEVYSGVIQVVGVDVELVEGRKLTVSKCGRQMIATKPLCGRPIGECYAPSQ